MGSSDRVACRLTQSIAPYAGRMPAETEFYPVVLNDISPTGFSYLAREFPGAEEIVIALDISSKPQLIARVLSQSKCGDRQVIVDCAFTGKVA